MKAMILCAGLGTRLKPITDKIPKALVEIEGVPVLERLILNLKSQGFDEIIINVHHFAEMVKNFIVSKDFGVNIEISDESDELLDTGGGIIKAYPLLFKNNDHPVLIHNVDILSNADLRSFYKKGTDTKLLVSDRESSRKLIFDDNMVLKGWHNLQTDSYRPEGINISPMGDFREFAFSGIYVMSKASIDEMKELLGKGKYSVMDYFLHERRRKEIKGEVDKDLQLLDIGKPATLLQASKFVLKN